MKRNIRIALALLLCLAAAPRALAQFENVDDTIRLGGKEVYQKNYHYYAVFSNYMNRFRVEAKNPDGSIRKDANGNTLYNQNDFKLVPDEWPCDSMYESWRRLYDGAPFYTVNTYLYGATMLDSLARHAKKSDAERLMYFQDLMQVYEDRIRRNDSLNSTLKNERAKSKRSAVMAKAADVYYNTAPLVKGSGYNPEKAYQNYVKAFEAVRNESDAGSDEINPSYLVNYFLACRDFYKTDEEKHLEQFLTDYITCLESCDKMKAAYINIDPDKWEKYAWAYDKTRYEFQTSGAAEPKKLINYFGPRIEEHSKDIDYLNNVVYLMFYNGLINNDAFFDACEKAYFIKPSFENCIGMGQMSITIDKDRIGAKKYFDEASEIAKDAKERYLAALFTGDALRATPAPPKVDGEDTNTRNEKLREWFGTLRGACTYYNRALENAHDAGVDDQTQADIYWKIANTYYSAQEWDKARENKNMILACYPQFSNGDIQDLSTKIETNATKAAQKAAADEATRRANDKARKAYDDYVAKKKAEDDFWGATKR